MNTLGPVSQCVFVVILSLKYLSRLFDKAIVLDDWFANNVTDELFHSARAGCKRTIFGAFLIFVL